MGKELTRVDDDIGIEMPDMMPMFMMFMMFMMVSFMTTVVSPMAQQLQAQSFGGNIGAQILSATDKLQYVDFVNEPPFTPLISVFLINRGSNTVYLAANNTAAGSWIVLGPGETRAISNVGATRRIELLFYKCDTGKTSSVEMEGHY